ncbi:IS3 family transposase [Bifidobacterium tissieri]|uniref:IS3 family transposase n=1 Tax=Bifidobacterium tissieri TaxID=1630162 RepID=A0A5M9ZGE3_9BIFI|nr:helix-turn-helix domain-containing protein [Bifidobacterium tissieri]KAA8825706.1 IS3 family transposase [Bifidobacterium tissieri]
MCVDRRRRYGDDFRKAALVLIRRGLGAGALARRICMPRQTAEKWVLLYRIGGEAALMGEREGNRRYDYETKLAAVRDRVEHGLTKAEVMARYGIVGITTLENWCREYRAGGPDALRPRPKGRPKGARSKPKPEPTRERLLEEENAYLKARVAYLEKARALLASKSPTGRNR